MKVGLCQLLHHVVSILIPKVIDYYDTIQDRRVLSNVDPGYLQKLLPSGPPEQGEAWEDIQNDIGSQILPGLTHWYLFDH